MMLLVQLGQVNQGTATGVHHWGRLTMMLLVQLG
jgi:hypothetical protein